MVTRATKYKSDFDRLVDLNKQAANIVINIREFNKLEKQFAYQSKDWTLRDALMDAVWAGLLDEISVLNTKLQEPSKKSKPQE